MMMREPIPLKDILFVFGAWTLMIDSELCAELVSGDEVVLFDELQLEVGEQKGSRFVFIRERKCDLRRNV